MKYSNKTVLVAEMKNLEFDHNHEGDVHRCPLCWETNCDHEFDVTTDPFINMSEEVVYTDEIILYA
jgi:hypothetical protein